MLRFSKKKIIIIKISAFFFLLFFELKRKRGGDLRTFRALYTREVRKKKPKKLDGFLYFHAGNKFASLHGCETEEGEEVDEDTFCRDAKTRAKIEIARVNSGKKIEELLRRSDFEDGDFGGAGTSEKMEFFGAEFKVSIDGEFGRESVEKKATMESMERELMLQTFKGVERRGEPPKQSSNFNPHAFSRQKCPTRL